MILLLMMKNQKNDWGHKLAGHVKQEFVLENNFVRHQDL